LDGPQSYGAITAGGTDVVRSFTFLASGPCGGSVSPILHLQDGETDLGFLSRSFGLGALVPASTIVTNPTYLAIPGSGSVGPGSPYPSSITISNVNGPAAKVIVGLHGLSHTWSADVDVLLVGPSGQTCRLMANTGNGNPISDVELTFDDDASASLPQEDQI